jgi:hypothetical protein
MLPNLVIRFRDNLTDGHTDITFLLRVDWQTSCTTQRYLWPLPSRCELARQIQRLQLGQPSALDDTCPCPPTTTHDPPLSGNLNKTEETNGVGGGAAKYQPVSDIKSESSTCLQAPSNFSFSILYSSTSRLSYFPTVKDYFITYTSTGGGNTGLAGQTLHVMRYSQP